MPSTRVLHLQSEDGEGLRLELVPEGDRWATELLIDGVFYHFERVHNTLLTTDYCVDGDPHYVPQHDAEGYCYILAPFSRR